MAIRQRTGFPVLLGRFWPVVVAPPESPGVLGAARSPVQPG
jgi:hypothetical protein